MHTLLYWVRQSRRASFRILFIALVLAVAAISSVGVFSARLEAALTRDATQMLGGDLVVESKRDINTAQWFKLLEKPAYKTLKSAQSVAFPSVIPSDQQDLLVSVKAVSSTYPLSTNTRQVKRANRTAPTIEFLKYHLEGSAGESPQQQVTSKRTK